jgi:uncharacterized protein YndB with AHSA1/START domain
MTQKTQIKADEGQQDMWITRDFDLPLHLLFKAHEEPAIIEQWMGTKVLKQDNQKHGSYRYLTADPQGNVMFQASGAFHEFVPNQKITRTFEMENAPIGVQLEFYVFEALTDTTSRLTMHVLYESVALRDQVIQMGMSFGIGMAHDRLQAVAEKLLPKN